MCEDHMCLCVQQNDVREVTGLENPGCTMRNGVQEIVVHAEQESVMSCAVRAMQEMQGCAVRVREDDRL
jgi:hypothetical protein